MSDPTSDPLSDPLSGPLSDPTSEPTAELSAEPVAELSAEDAKLVTLARATRARTQAPEGAAVRDHDGRTYAAATVDLDALQLTAVQVCVAMAVASGARGLAAAVVLGDATELTLPDRAVLEEYAGPDVVVHLADARGNLVGP